MKLDLSDSIYPYLMRQLADQLLFIFVGIKVAS